MNHRLQTSLTLIKRLASHESARFFLLGAILALLLTPGNLSFDTERRLQVTRWMWTDESQVRPDDTFFLNSLPGKNGQPMAQFGIGQSVVMLPADVISHAVFGTNMTPLKVKLREILVYYLTFPLISGLVLLQARRLSGWFLDDARLADIATLAFAFCTSFLVYSRDSQENMLMNLCVLSGIWHGLRWGRDGLLRDAAGMGAFFGYLLLIRVSTIAVIFPLTLALVMGSLPCHWKENRNRLLVGITVMGSILAAFVVMDRVYHWHRFGEFTRTYADYMIDKAKLYGHTDNFPMGNPFWSGIRSFAFDPRKAFYLFDPLVFISALAIFLPFSTQHTSRLRGLLAASFAAIALTACLYAGSQFWHGDSSWGPRHLNVAIIPAVLFGIISMFHYLAKHPSPKLRAVFSAVLLVGFVIQTLSLPLYHDLEVDQAKAGYPVTFPPVLRAMNLVSSVKGDPALWGLDCGNDGIQTLQKLPLQFTAFQLARKIPNSLTGNILIALWWVALLGFLSVLGIWFARIAANGRKVTGKSA